MAKKKKRKKNDEGICYPITICKFFQRNGECTELADKLCGMKEINWLGTLKGDDRVAICHKYKMEE